MKFRNWFIFGFDTETIKENDKHKFYCFQVYSNLGSGVFFSIYDFKNLHKIFKIKKWENNKKNKILLVSHNAEFDTSVIISELDNKKINYDVKIKYNRSSFLKSSFYFTNKGNPDIQIIDLMNFLGRKKLEEIAQKFGLEKLKKPEFLGEREPKTKQEEDYFIKYALNDAKICYIVFKNILQTSQKYAKIKSIPLSAPSLAFKLFKSKNKLPQYNNKFDFIINQLLRGGRTECFFRGCVSCENFGKIYCFDYNSLYPFVMYKYSFPGNFLCSNYDINYENKGFAIAKVKIYDNYIGPLGIHEFVKGYKKLIFPVGKIRGIFTFEELEFLENEGLGKVEKIIKSYHFESIESPFKSFIEFFYNLRSKKEYKYIAKLIMNSLFGRLSTRLYSVSIKKIDLENVEPNEIVGYIIDWENSSNLARKVVNSNRFVGENPLISCYITSLARIILTKKIIEILDLGKNVFYCDTDSIFTNYKINDSEKLGELKLEGVYDKCIFIRSKSYITINNNNIEYKFKGIPKEFSINTPKNAINFDVFEFKHIKGLRESLSRKYNPLQEETRKIFFLYEDDGKRHYFKDLDSKQKIMEDWTDSEPLKF